MQKRALFLSLPIVCVLGYFIASTVEEKVEYRFSDHPRMLCGDWYWQIHNGSGYSLYSDGTGFSYGEKGENRTPLHWKCRNGVMKMYYEDPRYTDTIWTEYTFNRKGELVCTSEAKEAQWPRTVQYLERPI